MFLRMFLTFLSLLVVAMATIAVRAGRITRERVLDETELRLEAEAAALQPYLATQPARDALQDEIRKLSGRTGARLTVIDAEGVVQADSHQDPRVMDNHNLRPEVVQARAAGSGRNFRYSDTLRVEMMYYAVLLNSSKPRDIVVRCALPLHRGQEEVRAVYLEIAGAFLLIGVAGTGVTYLLARWMTQPLREIQAVAQAITRGDFGQKASVWATGEVGDVGRAINSMADELAARLASLTAATSQLEAVIGSMQDAVVAVDGQGGVLHHNASSKTLLDIRVDPTGLGVWEAIRLPGLQDAVGKVLRERTTVRILREVGPRAVSLIVCPIAASNGAVLVAHDITEDRRYDSLRREFVANVSHELRTPISVIQGFVETLKDGAWKDEQRAPEFLEAVHRHAQRLAAIVEDLLQLSRLESAGQLVKLSWIDAGPFFERIRDEHEPLAERKQQTFSLEVDPGLEGFRADPDLLERAVGNLVDNAIKYTPDGGKVRVRVQPTRSGVAIEVTDTGIGIPEADCTRVFERFYRVDKSRSREMGGTGLGLAIVKHIVQLHGGSVSVQSRVGAGSVFTVSLPRGIGPVEPAAGSAEGDPTT